MEQLHEDYLSLQEIMQRGQEGTQNYIPLGYPRLSGVFNLTQSQFTLLGSTSGAGKSGFIDELVVLNPWRSSVYIEKPEINWDCMLFVMERSIPHRLARWKSWMIYRDTKLLVSPTALFGRDSRGKLGDKAMKLAYSYGDEISELRDSVDMYDGRISPALIKRQVQRKAAQLGTLYRADSVGVKKNNNDLVYEARFSDSLTRTKRNGEIEQYVEMEHNGVKFTLAPDKHKYFPNKPNTYFFIVLDGLGLIDHAGYANLKAAIDDIIGFLADARDVYGFSPVVVSQFNRGIANIERLKLHKSNMSPQESDFKDSGNAYHASDLAVALFDPYKMKAYDNKGMFLGYDLTTGMMAPSGYNRFRSVHILKNTWGGDGAIMPMKFMGESMAFSELPRYNDPMLADVYSKVALGL